MRDVQRGEEVGCSIILENHEVPSRRREGGVILGGHG